MTQDTWTRIDVGPEGTDTAFSIALPQGWSYRPLMGIDSFVGAFEGDDISIEFDHGMYSNPLAEPGDPGYEIGYERISCRRAKVVEAVSAPARVTGIYFEEVSLHSPFGAVRLQVSGIGLDAAERALVLQIVRTIRFDAFCVHAGGAHWETFDAPPASFPEDIDLIPPDQGWAVGRSLPSGETRAGCATLRLVDSEWVEIECPASSPLSAVAMASADGGWAIGGETILRWSDSAWSVYSDTLGAQLFDVALAGPDDGWIVGDGIVLRLRDGTWHPTDTGLSFDPKVIAVNISGTVVAAADSSLATFEDGVWTETSIPVADLRIVAVEPSGPGRTWLAGDAGATDTGTMVRFLAPGIFDRMPIPDAHTIWDVFDLGHFPGPERAWAVGGGSWAGPAEILYMDGSDWTRVEAPFDGYLKALDLWRPEAGWAVGGKLSDDVGVRGVFMRLLPDGLALDVPVTLTPSLTPLPAEPTFTPSPTRPESTATPTIHAGLGPSSVYLPFALAWGERVIAASR